MPVLEFTKTVDNFVEADLHGVHERVEVQLGRDRLKVSVITAAQLTLSSDWLINVF